MAAAEDSQYVQYGCGWSAPAEWMNFDASLTLRYERLPLVGRYTKNDRRFPANVRFGDIVQGLPVGDKSCRGLYASHVLKHLALEDFHKALQNSYRILRTGGIFRLIVPDLGTRRPPVRAPCGFRGCGSKFLFSSRDDPGRRTARTGADGRGQANVSNFGTFVDLG